LRAVRASLPSSAPTTIVSSGSVDKASAPRAAVVKISDALNRIGNRAKYSTPNPATPDQSRRGGHRPPCRSAAGNNSRNPMPNRNEPIASGSIAFTR
jgi:hypothetical protein